jgi:hypothetical protein
MSHTATELQQKIDKLIEAYRADLTAKTEALLAQLDDSAKAPNDQSDAYYAVSTILTCPERLHRTD